MYRFKEDAESQTSYRIIPVSQHPRVPAIGITPLFLNCSDVSTEFVREARAMDTHQHSSPAETHHTQSALEHEAFIVSGSYARLESFGAADSVSFLGLPFWVVHPLHVLSQFVFPLREDQSQGINNSSNSTAYCYKQELGCKLFRPLFGFSSPGLLIELHALDSTAGTLLGLHLSLKRS